MVRKEVAFSRASGRRLNSYGGTTIIHGEWICKKLKPLEWVGSSKSDLKGFPPGVQDRVGFALYQAQVGSKHRDAKPLKGLGSGVLEVVARHHGGTYRAIYLVQFGAAVYVLHAFQKRAKRGIATPRREMEIVRRRLKAAEQHYGANYGKG